MASRHETTVYKIIFLTVLILLCFSQPSLAGDQLLPAPPFINWPFMIVGLAYGLIIGAVIIRIFNTSKRFTYFSMIALFCFIFEFGVNIAVFLTRAGSDIPQVIDNCFIIFWSLILPIILLWIVCYYSIKKEERTFNRTFKVSFWAIASYYALSFLVLELIYAGLLNSLLFLYPN